MTEGKKGHGRGKREEAPERVPLEARKGAPQGRGSRPFSLFLFAFFLLGCKHKKPGTEDKEKKDDKPPVSAVGTGAASTLVYQSSDPKSPPSFSLYWTQGTFDIAKGGLDKGHMILPKGQIYQNGKPSTDYRSETGDANNAAKRLDMKDKVVFRAIDGKGTLHSDRGQYRGDLKIIRAMGNVVGTGPFGTLSGAPELWATPDFKIIGSPDMVAQKLKLPALVALAATAAIGRPVLQKEGERTLSNFQKPFIQNLSPGYRVTVQPIPGKGPILLTMPARGLIIRSMGTVVVDYVNNEVRHLTSQGPVNVVQTTPVGVNTLDGVGSVYDAPANAETGTLDIGGRVTLVSGGKDKSGGRTVTTAKGDKGRAILLQRTPPGGDGLRRATLTGNVVVDSLGADGGTFNGTGDQGVYTPHGDAADVDMSGSVVMTSVTTGKDKDAEGKPVTNRTVAHGDTGHGVIDAKTAAGVSPLRNAVLDHHVTLDVSGSNGQTFKGTNGDRLVYTARGEGGKAVMTGPALKFAGEGSEFLGNTTGADTATILIGKEGWQTVALDNSGGTSTTTTVLPKPGTKPVKPATATKKGKGGKP